MAGAAFGFGRAVRSTTNPNVPAYYTSNSGFLLSYVAFSANATLIAASNIATGSPAIRTYSSIYTSPRYWNLSHDKDLDSNIYYGIGQTGGGLIRMTLPTGGGAVNNFTLYTDIGIPSIIISTAYIPVCMWTGTGYGGICAAGFSSGNIRVLYFNAAKTSISSAYTISWSATPTPEIYGVEVVPKAVSGFNNNYGLAYSRNNKSMTSWTVNMDTNTWSNKATDSTYVSATTGPSNGDAMCYYPIGKAIFTGDPDTSTHRIAMSDSSTARLYVWTITESGTSIVWTYLKQVTVQANGTNPYHLSVAAYNALL